MTKAPRPGSQSALREANETRMLQALHDLGPATQSALAERTGLSRATVSNLVHALAGRDIVHTSPTVSGGRRATLVALADAPVPVVIGVDFGRRHVRVVIASLDLEVLAEDAVALPQGHPADESLVVAADLLDTMLHGADVARSRVRGVCVGIPGPIDAARGIVVDGSILPEWVGVTRAAVAEALGFDVQIANDADLGAIAEHAWGPHEGVDELMFVKVATGIGAGLLFGGRLHKGASGLTGEIGHTPIDAGGALCACGNRGCLETVASTRVMTSGLSAVFDRSISTADVVELAQQGNRVVLRVVEEAGLAIGRAVAVACNLVGPEVVVIGGPLASLGEVLIEPVRDGFRRFSIPSQLGRTTIAAASLGERAEALGAVAAARLSSVVTGS